jgi:hypothetical protein
VFLLSPANCSGVRASMVFNPRARFDVADRLRAGKATLGEVFAFISGLYFRGKLAYVERFARVLPGEEPGWVITPSRGLVSPRGPVSLDVLREFAASDVDPRRETFRAPLERDAQALNVLAGPGADVVLLGSVATAKYTDVLTKVFGDRLRFPAEFVGRGDMSRGALMLRAARERRELQYVRVNGAVVHGPRARRISELP